MTQWHPLFAQLLRPVLESHYEIQTNVPVGDVPRQADVVVLRRKSSGPPPFTGLWRWLTAWNILEFKGPSVSARVGDLDALLELGLGIHRRLAAERATPRVNRAEVSIWYLANHLGRRFLTAARVLIGPLEQLADGVWRTSVWQRPLLLVSNRAVTVERDSLPVHLLTVEPLPRQREVAEVLRAQSQLLEPYALWLSGLHPTLAQEMTQMGRTRQRKKGLHFDFRGVVDFLGWKEVLRLINMQELVQQLDLAKLTAQLTPAQKREMLRLLEQEPPPREPTKHRD